MIRALLSLLFRPASLPALALVFALSAGIGSVRAADAPAAATTPSAALSGSTAMSGSEAAQAQALINTLQDPDARAKLIAQLTLLADVQKPAAPPPAKSGTLVELTQTLQDASDSILSDAADIADIGNVVDWLAAQVSDEHAQKRVMRIVIRLVVVFLGGLILEWVLRRLLARPRRYLESRSPANRWLRVPIAAAHWICELVPVAGFAASAYAMLALPFYRPGGHSESVSVAAITAYALSAAVATFIEAIFAPGHPTLRVFTMDEAVAVRLTRRLTRIVTIGIWGYYIDDVLRILGMPQGAFESVLKLLGLTLAIMLIVVVFEYRGPVARWIRGISLPAPAPNAPLARVEINRRLAGFRGTLADIWHLLATLYVLAAFVIWALRVEGGFEFLLRATLFTAAILVGARLLSGILHRHIDRAFQIGRADPHGKLAARRRRYHRITITLAELAIAIIAVLAILQAWGADTLSWLGGDSGQRVVISAAKIVTAIAISVGVWELVSAGIERYLSRTDPDGTVIARSARARTLLPLMRNAFTVLLFLVVGMIVLTEVGVNVAPLIAGAGVLGVAIGFGSQKLVQDVITGAFILFEDTIAVGDTVNIANHVGTVESMTIRTLTLRSGTGELHTLPFSSVTAVINQSRGFANFPFSVGVSYREDVDKVIGIMREVGAELRKDASVAALMTGPVEVFGVDKFTDMAVMVSGQIRTQPGQQDTVGREFYRRLKKRFDELGIVMPHALYMGADGKLHATTAADPSLPIKTPAAAATPPAPPPPDAREP